MVWEVSGYRTVADWAPDGRALIVSRHHSNVNNDLYRLNLETGEATLLTGHEGDARFSSANVTPDGGGLYLATDRDGEFLRLARLDLATLELEYLTPDDRDVERRRAFEGRPLPRREPQRGRLFRRTALQPQGTQDA